MPPSTPQNSTTVSPTTGNYINNGALGTTNVPTSAPAVSNPTTPVTPAPVVPAPQYAAPTKPVVVSSPAAATTDLNNKQTFLDNTNESLKQQQIANLQAQKAAAETQLAKAQAEQDAKDKADQLALKQQELAAKSNLTTAATGGTPATTYQGADGNTYDSKTGQIVSTGSAPGVQDITSINAELDQNAKNATDSLNQIINGTFPLSAIEQSMVDSTRQQVANMVAQQKIANQNYEGGVTQAGITSGVSRYSPMIAQGQIFAAVSAGLAKIQEIETNGANAIAKMQEGFMTQKFDQVSKYYDIVTNSLKEKRDAIQKINDTAIAAAKDARDYNYKVAQDTIDNQLKSNEFDYKKTQDAIDNAFKQGQIDETQRHNMATEALTRAAQGGGPFEGATTGLPQVQMTGENRPDATSQAAFLALLPGGATGDTATLVKGIADYKLNINVNPQKNYRGTSGMTQAAVASLVLKYDPTYSESQYTQRNNYLNSLRSGPIYQGIQAANKSINHLIAFNDTVASFGTAGEVSPYENAFRNAVVQPFSQDLQFKIGQAQTQAAGLKLELPKFFKGTGATDVKSIDDWASRIDLNATPAGRKGTVQGALDLLAGQLDVMNQAYVATMGKAPDGNILQPETLNKLSTLKNEGFKVDIPGVNYTDKEAWQKYGNGTKADWDNAVDELTKKGYPLTDDNILWAVQQ